MRITCGSQWHRAILFMLCVMVAGAFCNSALAGSKKSSKKNEKTVVLLKPDTFEEALKQAAEEEKKVLLFVTSDSCGWCKYMKQTILTDPYLAMYINRFYIPVEANKSTENGKKILPPKDWKGVPYMQIFDTEGKELSFHRGTSHTPGGTVEWLLENANDDMKKEMDDLLDDCCKSAKTKKISCDSAEVIARIAAYLDKVKKVKNIYDKSISSSLNTDGRRNAYVWFWTQNKDNLKHALKIGEEMIEKTKEKNKDGYMRHSLAWCYYENGMLEKAVEMLKSAKPSGSDDKELYATDLKKFEDELAEKKK